MNQIPIPPITFIQSLIAPGKMTHSIQSAENEYQNNQNLNQNVGKGLYQINPNIIKTQSLQDTDQPTLSTNITKAIINRLQIPCQQQDKLRQQQEQNKKKQKQMQIQIQRLNSLRKQYQLIRKMQARRNQKLRYNIITPTKNKNKSPSSSYQESSKSEIYIKDRHSTSKNKQRDRDRDRDYRLLQYQKKQLEIILSRNMDRFEQMIRNQIEYKRKIFELTKNNPISKQQQSTKSLIDRLKSDEKKLRNQIAELKQTLQKQTKKISMLQAKSEQVDKKNFSLQTQLRRVKEEKRTVEQKKFLLAQAQLTNKIRIKCQIMQKQMIIKQKQVQKENFNKIIQTMSDERQKLLDKINQRHQEYQELLQKFNQSEKQKNQLKTELKNKQQVKINNIIKRQEKEGLQNRVQILQKKIQSQNSQKSAFLFELKRVMKDFQQLDNENILLRQKLRISQTQRIKLSSQKSSIEYELSAIQLSKMQKRNPNQLIKHIKSEIKYKNSEQTEKQKSILEQKILTLQTQLQNLKQKVRLHQKKQEELLEQNQKMRKKYDLALQILHKKYQSQIQIINNYKNRLLSEVNQEKLKFLQLKHLVPFQIQKIIKQHGHNIGLIKQKYDKELKILKVDLNNLQRENEFFAFQNSILINDRIQKYQLTEKVKNMICLRQKVDHLWFIKEIQYANLNAILFEIKKQPEKSSIIQKLHS